MDRRSFLKGAFGGVTAAGLIVAAKPEEIEFFSKTIQSGAPVVIDKSPQSEIVEQGTHLYNEKGQLVAIVTQTVIATPSIDVTSMLDQVQRYIPGRPEIHIEAVGVANHFRGIKVR